MIVLHSGPVDWRRPSGLNASIPGIVEAQNNLAGVDAALLTVSREPNEPDKLSFPVFDNERLLSPEELPSPYSKPDLIIFHSTYLPAYRAIAKYAVRMGIPYIITPRGGLTRAAQKSKRWKKLLANATAFRSYFNNAAGFHFLTEGEAKESRSWRSPHFVVGNGVNLPNETFVSSPGTNPTMRFVFVGRIDMHIKGLDLLVKASELVRDELQRNHAHIDLYGAHLGDDSGKLARLIEAMGLSDLIQVKPRISESERDQVLQDADLFLLPSRTEAHPVAALEALAFGVPCLVSESARVGEELEEAGAGWMVPLDPGSLGKAMTRAISERESLRAMGKAGRALVEKKYAWPAIAQQTVDGYRQVLGSR